VRIGRRVPVVAAAAIAVTLVGGVAAAVTATQASTAKACVTSGGALRLSTGGKCASGQTAITLGAQGPRGLRGAPGPKGARGAKGPKGDQGPAGSATPINLSQFLIDTGTTPATHYLGSAGPVSLIATCAGTTSQPTLLLTVGAGTQSFSFTDTDVASNDAGPPTVLLSHGAAGSLASAALPVDTTDGTVNDTESDVITLIVATQDGSQVTGTLDVEINATPGDTACSVNGSLSAA
jgi:hypothetical protein